MYLNDQNHITARLMILYCIRQIIRGGKLSWFLWIFANRKCFTIEIFLEYQRRPLTTQSMVLPGLINNEQSIEMLCGTWPTMLPLFNSYCILISWISLFPLKNQLFSNYLEWFDICGMLDNVKIGNLKKKNRDHKKVPKQDKDASNL